MVQLARLLREEEAGSAASSSPRSLEAYLLGDAGVARRRRRSSEEKYDDDDENGDGEGDGQAGLDLDARVAAALRREVEITDGLALFSRLQSSVLLPSGIETLDALLGGGLREGQVTELFGPSPSGKTQVCHCIAACAAWLDYQVVYITSNGSFSSDRLVKLSRHVLGHFNLRDSTETVESVPKILQNVSVTSVTDAASLAALFQGMVESFGFLEKHGKPVPKVVLVDSPSLLLYRDLATSQPRGKLVMTMLTSAMSKLAHRFSVAVVVTNHEVRPFRAKAEGDAARAGEVGVGDGGKPGLGILWGPQASVRVRLRMFRAEPRRAGGESEDEGLVAEERKRERLVLCRATLVKSSTSECGREAWMRMGKSGVDGIDDPRTSEELDVLDISAWT